MILLAPDDVRSYIEREGWRLTETTESGVEMWFRSSRSKYIYLPPSGQGWAHEDARAAVSQVAIEERRPFEKVVEDIGGAS